MKNSDQTALTLAMYIQHLEKEGLSRSSIHHVLLERAMDILANNSPYATEKLSPMKKYMLHVIKKPDSRNDYEKGMGRHYYCSMNLTGKHVSPVCGYYRNALGHFGKSARSMLEENYTMALTMYNAGYIMQASGHLARAVHMLCDICCLPHSVCMTYFSPYAKIHNVYEKVASYIYPDLLPQKYNKIPQYFHDRHSFGAVINSITETIRSELPKFWDDPVDNIKTRLYDAEIKTASLLERFVQDTELSPHKAHYITDGMRCQPLERLSDPYTVHVTENALVLSSNGKIITHPYGGNSRSFTAAHRKNGLYTISPARFHEDRVMTEKGFSRFDPRKKEQFYIFDPMR